jgi:Tfp pilus assembly protein PilF
MRSKVIIAAVAALLLVPVAAMGATEAQAVKFLKAGQYEQAVKEADGVLKGKSKSALAYFVKAFALTELKKPKEAF